MDKLSIPLPKDAVDYSIAQWLPYYALPFLFGFLIIIAGIGSTILHYQELDHLSIILIQVFSLALGVGIIYSGQRQKIKVTKIKKLILDNQETGFEINDEGIKINIALIVDYWVLVHLRKQNIGVLFIKWPDVQSFNLYEHPIHTNMLSRTYRIELKKGSESRKLVDDHESVDVYAHFFKEQHSAIIKYFKY